MQATCLRALRRGKHTCHYGCYFSAITTSDSPRASLKAAMRFLTSGAGLVPPVRYLGNKLNRPMRDAGIECRQLHSMFFGQFGKI
jgi:hypothetical protein